MGAADERSGFGIYVHWPFCAAKCPYCDFNSHVRKSVDHGAWKNALLADLERQAARSDALRVTSVFFGGGTPSLMLPATVGALLDRIAALFDVAPDVEITLEANPTSVEAARFAGFRTAGVNRVSTGVQSFDDASLKALGRLHTASEAMKAIDIAQANFERMSFDMIYARQNQTVSDWEAELAQALALQVGHLSAYQLTIEDGTRFGDLYQRGQLRGLPSSDRGAEMYEVTQDICEGAGLHCYEVSNHAVIGQECRHNLTYWRGEPYLGIGPGAHGRRLEDGCHVATETIRTPEKWLEAVLAGGDGMAGQERLTGAERGTEYALMALRLAEGMSRTRLAGFGDVGIKDAALSQLADDGYVVVAEDRITATTKGRAVLNTVISEILS